MESKARIIKRGEDLTPHKCSTIINALFDYQGPTLGTIVECSCGKQYIVKPENFWAVAVGKTCYTPHAWWMRYRG